MRKGTKLISSVILNRKGAMAFGLGVALIAVLGPIMWTICIVCHYTGTLCNLEFTGVCSGDSPTSTVYCQVPGKPEITELEMAVKCCDPKDLSSYLPTPDCLLDGPPFPELNGGVIPSVQTTLNNANAAIKQAEELVGEVSPEFNDAGGGASSAASEGESFKSKSEDKPLAGTAAPAANLSKSGSGGSAGNSGTGLGGLASGSTAPTGEDKKAEEKSSLVLGGDGEYTGSDGVGGVANGGGRRGLGQGQSISGDAGKSGALSFGPKSDSENPVLTADPEDYFTRIGLEDSIFKILHNRYQGIHLTWTRSGVSAGRAATKPNSAPLSTIPKPVR